MKPVHQTELGPRGNCMSAALASILELPLESVPNFYDAGPTERHWHNALKGWLASIGYALIEVPVGENGPGAFHWGGYAIASGPTVRENGWHATVWHNGKVVHDPHPDGAGILKLETLEFLYPLDPAAMSLARPEAAPPVWDRIERRKDNWTTHFVDPGEEYDGWSEKEKAEELLREITQMTDNEGIQRKIADYFKATKL